MLNSDVLPAALLETSFNYWHVRWTWTQ